MIHRWHRIWFLPEIREVATLLWFHLTTL